MLFLRSVFRAGLISSSKLWWGLPQKGRPSWIEISWGGGWTKRSHFIFSGGGSDTLEDTMVVIFSDVNLASNYHDCKEEAINLIPQYLIDIIHKLVKPSHLEKLQIIQNINKLMFQAIFTFSDRTLIKQLSFFHPFRLGWRKQIFKKFYLQFWLEDWGMSKTA